MMLPAPEPQPEQDARLIRPLRMGTKESGPRESAYNPERAGKTGSGATMAVAGGGVLPEAEARPGVVDLAAAEAPVAVERGGRGVRQEAHALAASSDGARAKVAEAAPRLKIWESRRLRPRGRRLRVELRRGKCLRGRCLRPGER